MASRRATGKIPAKYRKMGRTLGARGGLKGGPARASRMTASQRSASARKAANARWRKK